MNLGSQVVTDSWDSDVPAKREAALWFELGIFLQRFRVESLTCELWGRWSSMTGRGAGFLSLSSRPMQKPQQPPR